MKYVASIKVILLVLLSFVALNIKAQYITKVYITSAPTYDIGLTISENLSALCTAFNSAQYAKTSLSFDGVQISDNAKRDLCTLWENCAFRCNETELELPLLRTSAFWQVRNIPIVLMPGHDAKYYDGLYQELVVNFSPEGQIIDVYFSIKSHLYSKVIKSNLIETDLNRRLFIIDFVERFRTAYNRKDINFISDVFSDDALIIEGREIKRVPSDNQNLHLNSSRFEMVVKTKAEYIKSLRRVFSTNQTVKVDFSDIKVVKHPTKPNYYGVTVKQGWSIDTYGDMGYVFLLVDFRVYNKPIIHVRTWQPEKYKSGEAVSEVDIFSISDFECE